jgi:hypothetical protein
MSGIKEKNKQLEGLIKDKLKENGVSESWMKEHLIVDTMDSDEDYCEHCGAHLEDCTGYKCWKR